MPRNERLLDAVNRAALTPAALAQRLEVDPKTVERWVTHGRVPYRRHRHELAALLGEPEQWLWPIEVGAERRERATESELVRIYAHRYQVPAELWSRIFGRATVACDVLVYAGLFLPEQSPGICDLLARKAADGVRVRLLVGDPDSQHVRIRGEEEGIGDAVAVQIRNAMHLLRPLTDTPVQVRVHASTLYASIYRGDDEMIVNTHVLGLPGAQAPALHLRRLAAGELFDTYTASFDRVWDAAKPATDRRA